MNKRKLCIIAAVLFSVPCAVLREGGAPEQSLAVSPAQAGVQSYFGLDAGLRRHDNLADLDVRDAQNHVIQSHGHTDQLATLFQENLYRLRVVDPPHSMRQSMDGLNLYLNLFLSVFFNSVQRLFLHMEQAIAPSKKRFVHNVDKLWITFIVGLFVWFLQICRTHLKNGPLRLNLRC